MTKLIPVRTAHQFDQARLSDYLVAHADASPLQRVRQYAGGQSNPTFLLELEDGRRWVLRKKPPGRLLPSAHLVEREYQAMSALSGSAVPVPAMVHLCQDDSIIGTTFYVMEHLEGRVFVDTTMLDESIDTRRAVYAAMVDGLAALHQLDYRSVGLERFGKPDGYLERQIAIWTKQYLAAKTEETPDMDFLMDWLANNLPAAQGTTIAHGDYRLGNLMFAADEPQLIAVLDWELATLGDPLSDLAYNCIAYDMSPAVADLPGLAGLQLDQLGIPDEQQYITQYCAATGRDEITDWHFYMAFAYFRLSSICQGVYARGLQGNASDTKALGYGDMAKWLAGMGRKRALT